MPTVFSGSARGAVRVGSRAHRGRHTEPVAFSPEVAGRSLTDLEITYALLGQGRSARALFFLREPSYLEYVAPAERQHFRAENSDAEARARDLRLRIQDSGFPINLYSTPQVFAYQALEQLWQLLQNDLPPLSQVSGVTNAETRFQELYIRTLAERAIERPRYYAAIDSHLASSSAPLVLVGEPGIGKSVLLARWVLRRRETHPSDIVIFHSAEASSASSHADFSIARPAHRTNASTPRRSDLRLRRERVRSTSRCGT